MSGFYETKNLGILFVIHRIRALVLGIVSNGEKRGENGAQLGQTIRTNLGHVEHLFVSIFFRQAIITINLIYFLYKVCKDEIFITAIPGPFCAFGAKMCFYSSYSSRG